MAEAPHVGADKTTDPRPDYFEIGQDTEGAAHVYRAEDSTVHVVEDGQRTQRFELDDKTLDDYVRFVKDKVDGREWDIRRYTLSDECGYARMVDHIAEAM
jgi:hypothetical protein